MSEFVLRDPQPAEPLTETRGEDAIIPVENRDPDPSDPLTKTRGEDATAPAVESRDPDPSPDPDPDPDPEEVTMSRGEDALIAQAT